MSSVFLCHRFGPDATSDAQGSRASNLRGKSVSSISDATPANSVSWVFIGMALLKLIRFCVRKREHLSGEMEWTRLQHQSAF
jgi:hypothetical protein